MWLTIHVIFFINYDYRVRTAAKWVCMLRFWSHLSVQGYCSPSPNKADAGFPAETTILLSEEFSFWGVDDKKGLSNKKCYELRRHVTDALLRSLNLQLLPQYFFCWVRYVKEEVWRKLSWKRQLYLFWFGPIPRNETKQWEFQNCRCFATMVLLWKYWRSHSFTNMEFLMRYKHVHLFCRCVLREYHGLFLRSSAAFVVLRILRSFVERFYLLKKHDCKTWSVSIYHLKS